MKTITFKEKEYNIPQSWDEITVGMIIKSNDYAELLPDAPSIAILHAYTGIPMKELKISNATEVMEIMEIMGFLSEEYKPVMGTSLTINGQTYSCNDDITQQNFEDWVSVQTTLFNYKDEPVRALPKLLAIMCKKEGEHLDDFDLGERTELMYGARLTDAKNIEAFFLHSLSASRAITLLYSTTKEREEIVLHKIKELQLILSKRKAQSGGFSLTRLLIGIYQKYLKSLESHLQKSFNSSPSKP